MLRRCLALTDKVYALAQLLYNLPEDVLPVHV